MRTNLASDATLLAAAGRGDCDAFCVLYERHAGWLASRLHRRCGDRSAVEEAVQDTFLAAWRNAGSYEARGDVGAWLWGIAVRRLIDGLRRRPPPALPLRDGRDAGVSPPGEIEWLELRDAHALLARLPERQREVARATVIDGLTMREAAARLGVPVGTVKTRLMRARATLRTMVAADWQGEAA